MPRSYLLLPAIIIILPLVGIGCINITTTKSVDGGVFRSDDSGETWAQKVFIRQEKKDIISINNANVGTIVFHPTDKNVLYLGTLESGVYLSQDQGEKWVQSGLKSGSFSTISIDPQTPSIFYTANGSSILKTSDDGVTFETIYLEPRGQQITSINIDSFDPSKVYASTQTGEIIQSTDYGENWSTIATLENGIKKLYINPQDTRIIYAVTEKNGIYKTTDGGKAWNLISGDFANYPGSNAIHWLYFTEKDPNIIYVATNYGLLKSNNGGANWNPITTLFPFGSVPIKTVAVNPDNHSEIWFTIDKVVHKTTDSGATWKTIETFPSNRTITSLLVDPDNPQVLYAGTYAPKKK